MHIFAVKLTKILVLETTIFGSKMMVKSDLRDHPFNMSACFRGGGVSSCANGQKVRVAFGF